LPAKIATFLSQWSQLVEASLVPLKIDPARDATGHGTAKSEVWVSDSISVKEPEDTDHQGRQEDHAAPAAWPWSV